MAYLQSSTATGHSMTVCGQPQHHPHMHLGPSSSVGHKLYACLQASNWLLCFQLQPISQQ